jgi:hypothetical protein
MANAILEYWGVFGQLTPVADVAFFFFFPSEQAEATMTAVMPESYW